MEGTVSVRQWQKQKVLSRCDKHIWRVESVPWETSLVFDERTTMSGIKAHKLRRKTHKRSGNSHRNRQLGAWLGPTVLLEKDGGSHNPLYEYMKA